jgi:DtxR family Mn-dependent transcriptional regulator
LRRANARPGEVVKVTSSAGGVLVGSGGEYVELSADVASHVFVVPG